MLGAVRSNMNANPLNHYRCETLIGCWVLVRWLMGLRRAFEAGWGGGTPPFPRSSVHLPFTREANPMLSSKFTCPSFSQDEIRRAQAESSFTDVITVAIAEAVRGGREDRELPIR